MSALLLFARAEYIEITEANVDELIGGSRPVFVKFYSPTCRWCNAMALAFSEAAELFTDVPFAGVDCTVKDRKICNAHSVDGYPTIKLFGPGNKTGVEFTGKRTVDRFCEFVTNLTGKVAKERVITMVDLDPTNFNQTIANEKCTFVTFFAPWCGFCKRFLPQAQIAAGGVVPEPKASVARVDCTEYRELCNRFNVTGYPTILLFKGTTKDPVPYRGPRTAEGVLDFLSEKCGIERQVDGLLNWKAGLVVGAVPLVQEFLLGDKAVARKMGKDIPGTEFYVQVMDELDAKGEQQIEKNIAEMEGGPEEQERDLAGS